MRNSIIIIDIAEYLNIIYKQDQFVNTVKNHESTQPNMNSITKSAAKIIEELSQLNGKIIIIIIIIIIIKQYRKFHPITG